MGCFIIAEVGVNHNGSAGTALQLVEAAARAGADAVKFQTFRAERLVRAGAEKAAYQQAATGAGDQLSMLRALELAPDAHERLVRRCAELGIEFMSTPFDIESASFLAGLGMRRIKIPSGELTNHPFLRELAALGLPLILSTGMATLEEVKAAVAVIRRAREHLPGPLGDALTLLHCTSNYPTALADVNLRALQTLQRECSLPVGYSDHTRDILVAPLAVAMGAVVIEKHLTLDHGLPGPDHAASLEPDEFARMVTAIRDAELALGTGVKAPAESELPIRALVRRSVTLRRPVRAGETLKAEDLELLRPGDGIPPGELRTVVGRRARASLPAGHTLQWADLEG
jgi:N-acetylneuraminate synthase